jgi:hypothetical protein
VAFRDCLSSERKTKVFLDLVKAMARVEAPISASEAAEGMAKMRKGHTFIDQLDYFAGADALATILPLWHSDLRGGSGSWSPAPVFERMSLTKAEVASFCVHVRAHSFAAMCSRFAVQYRKPGDQLLSDEDIDQLRERYNISGAKSKNFSYFIEAIYGAVRNIPSEVLDLARPVSGGDHNGQLAIALTDPKGVYMQDKIIPAIAAVIDVHHPNVHSLSFKNCKLNAQKTIWVLERVLVSKWLNIIHLDLGENQIEDKWLDSFKTIINAQAKHTLEVLELAGN